MGLQRRNDAWHPTRFRFWQLIEVLVSDAKLCVGDRRLLSDRQNIKRGKVGVQPLLVRFSMTDCTRAVSLRNRRSLPKPRIHLRVVSIFVKCHIYGYLARNMGGNGHDLHPVSRKLLERRSARACCATQLAGGHSGEGCRPDQLPAIIDPDWPRMSKPCDWEFTRASQTQSAPHDVSGAVNSTDCPESAASAASSEPGTRR